METCLGIQTKFLWFLFWSWSRFFNHCLGLESKKLSRNHRKKMKVYDKICCNFEPKTDVLFDRSRHKQVNLLYINSSTGEAKTIKFHQHLNSSNLTAILIAFKRE